MHEVADVHRDLFAESADSYGPSVRGKIAEAARRREDYREAADRALGELDLLLVPTLAFVAPPLPEDEREIRERVLQFTYPFNVLGWPVLALPAGPAEDGLPASAQLVGRPGADALVLAVGEVLEASLERGTA
jgi:Asp-tRNA(Asn)/Glu-tRNA(Gln) amidotransferase A subunit family amidase